MIEQGKVIFLIGVDFENGFSGGIDIMSVMAF